MNIYSISDLHFSFFKNKKMDCFGNVWTNHSEKIKKSWLEKVKKNDIVLLPGDFSWAMNLKEVESDFNFLFNLPGKKILIKGNHDYWWQSINKLRNKYSKECYFIQNDSLEINNFIFIGTRGWVLPEDINLWSIENEKIYKRELLRLEQSLKKIKNNRKKKILIAMLHFPPINKNGKNTEFSKLLKKYKVNICVYGHLHNNFNKRKFLSGNLDDILYYLVSCDYLNCKLKKII